MPDPHFLPTPEERTWILDRLRELIERCGAAPFVSGLILEPDPRYFPDAWEPNERGLRKLAKRLMGYAGLGRYEVAVKEDYPDLPNADGPDENSGTVVAWFAGFQGGTAVFGMIPDLLDDESSVAGALCHEVAHAFRTHHGVRNDDQREEELLTDLTTVYLGFGLLTAEAAERFVTGRTGEAASYDHTRIGYLGPIAFSYAVAAQLLARGEREETVRLIRHLPADQQKAVEEAWKDLQPIDLLARLGLPPASQWPPLIPRPKRAAPPPAPPPLAVDPRTEEDHRRNEGESVYRVLGNRGSEAALITMVGGLAVLMPILFWRFPEDALYGLLAGIPFAYLGYLRGRTIQRDRCSDPGCEYPLPPHLLRCPGCGGSIIGAIRNANDRLPD